VGPGPGQHVTLQVYDILLRVRDQGRGAYLAWVKGHAGTPVSEWAGALTGTAASRSAWLLQISLSYLKLRVSENESHVELRPKDTSYMT